MFTGLYDLKRPGEYPYLSVGGHDNDGSLCRGRPPYERLGREVRFEDLPGAYQNLVLDAYRRLWDL